MSLNVLGPKGLRRLNTSMGTEFLHASVEHGGVMGLGIDTTLRVQRFDRRARTALYCDVMTSTTREARAVVWALLGGRA